MQILVFLMLFLIPFFGIYGDRDLEKESELNLHASLFEKAAAGYENLLRNSGEIKKKREWSQNLALCFYRTENFAALPSLLEPLMPLNDQERLFLGAAYNHLARFEDAIRILTPSQNLELNSEIALERGIAYFKWKKYEDASTAFDAIPKNTRPYGLAQIAKIKMAIEQKDYASAQRTIAANVDLDSALVYEIYYLQGIIALSMGNRELAIDAFNKALPNLNAPWARNTLILLSEIYFGLAHDFSISKETRRDFFDKAIAALSSAESIYKTDDVSLALGNAYLAKGNNLEDNESLSLARTILSDSSLFSNREIQNQALFLSAQATETFEDRDAIYRRLTQEKNAQSSQYGFWWLYRGINDLSQSQVAKGEMRDMLVGRALSEFEKAEVYLPEREQTKAKIWSGRAFLLENTPAGFNKAKQLFAQLIPKLNDLDDPAELYYLYAQALNQGLDTQKQDIEWLQEGLSKHSSARGLFLLAVLHYKNEEWVQAENLFRGLIQSNDYELSAEALFWAGKSAFAAEGQNQRCKEYFQTLFKEHPHSPFAAEAYFSMYTYKEYLQGDREALKHLQQLPTLFPNSIYALNAHYLTGLDYKRDRKSNTGKKIHYRDLNAAIEAFNKVEEHFEFLSQKGLIPSDQLEYTIRLYYYAALERALANLTVADQSEGAKQEIFLQYSQELLEKIVEDFQNKAHPLAHKLSSKENFSAIEEEANYWLAKAFHKGKQIEKATETLQNMLDQFVQAKISRGYFLSRTWSELGTIYLEQQNYRKALASFDKADETAKGGILTSEDQLNLWIQKSECYRGQQDYENAIRILTQVTHEKVISSLRLKAMYLRSELYALQNRPELERNQLTALANKGGEWALKARQKLEEKYGY